MSLEIKNLRPGDTVLLPEDILFPIDDVAIVVAATKGSIGIVLSYEEYCDIIRKTHQANCEKYLAWVKLQIEAKSQYPIRIEKYAPYEHEETGSLYVECNVGYVTLLRTEYVEKIE